MQRGLPGEFQTHSTPRRSLPGRATDATLPAMECRQTRNQKRCSCSYSPCPRKGICCECLEFHLNQRELPACCFPPEAERTYDRSFEHFARLVTQGAV